VTLDFNSLTGAARGIRTPDPIITNDVLYQLSYCGAHPFKTRGRRILNGAAVYASFPRLGNTPKRGGETPASTFDSGSGK
jgi:hypothetical protein